MLPKRIMVENQDGYFELIELKDEVYINLDNGESFPVVQLQDFLQVLNENDRVYFLVDNQE